MSIIGQLFDIEYSQFRIHSLAYDASHEIKPRYKTATISFRTRPPQLDLARSESDGWSFDLKCEAWNKYGLDRISFDNQFEGFTPLSPAEKADEQIVE